MKQNILEKILIFINIILTIGIYGYFYYSYYYLETNEIIVYKEIEKESIFFYVDIKGAVNNPGVYQVCDDNVINDVIEIAGGLSKNAYTNNINLSKKLSKEMVIYIYTNEEYKDITKKNEDICSTQNEDISSCEGSSVIVVNNDDENTSNLININTASKEKLMSLSGIGESKADSIISYRTINGNFQSIEEIKLVSGISENLYEKIKDYITV